MAVSELQAYRLVCRHKATALQAYLDRLPAENPNPQTYGFKESVLDAVSNDLKQHKIL